MTDHSHHNLNLIGNKLDRRISFTTKNKSDWILLEFINSTYLTYSRSNLNSSVNFKSYDLVIGNLTI